MPRMMGSLTRVCRLTSLTVSPARRRAAASVAPMLTRASRIPEDRSLSGQRTRTGLRGKRRLRGQEPRSFGARLRTPAAQGGTLGAGLVGQGRGEGGEPGPQRGAIGTRRRPGCGRPAGRRCGRRRRRRWPPGFPRASARSTAASRARPGARAGTGTPITGSGVTEASMPGRCAAPPAPAMITLSPRRRGRAAVADHVVRHPVRGDDIGLVAGRRTRRAPRRPPASPASLSRCPSRRRPRAARSPSALRRSPVAHRPLPPAGRRPAGSSVPWLR